MTTEAQKRATMAYDAKNTKQVKIKLNYNTDQDIIDKLESVDNKQGYIKQLIRADISRYSELRNYLKKRLYETALNCVLDNATSDEAYASIADFRLDIWFDKYLKGNKNLNES